MIFFLDPSEGMENCKMSRKTGKSQGILKPTGHRDKRQVV